MLQTEGEAKIKTGSWMQLLWEEARRLMYWIEFVSQSRAN